MDAGAPELGETPGLADEPGDAGPLRDRLDRVMPRLPEDAQRPTLRKFDLASFPVLILGASSNLDPVQMRRIIDDEIKYRIERVPGVASLDVWGGLNREIHVNLYADKIKALHLPMDQLLDRIRALEALLAQDIASPYEVIVVNDRFGVRITEIISQADRVKNIA